MMKQLLAVCLIAGVGSLVACKKRQDTPTPGYTKPNFSGVATPNENAGIQSTPGNSAPANAGSTHAQPPIAGSNSTGGANSVQTPVSNAPAAMIEDAERLKISMEQEKKRIERVEFELKAAASTPEGARYSVLAAKRAAKVKAVRARRAAEAQKRLNSASSPGKSQ